MSSMKEGPILMSAPMVIGTLSDWKTQTRRTRGLELFSENDPDNWEWVRIKGNIAYFAYKNSPMEREAKCPYGKVGDRLWVRETWRGVVKISPHDAPTEYAVARYVPDQEHCRRVEYAATHQRDGEPWRPSIHMPRWASRITLEITGVRVERLQDISEADAMAEGVIRVKPNLPYWMNYQTSTAHENNFTCLSALDSFKTLWESINGPESWNLNPWVWCVSFKRINHE